MDLVIDRPASQMSAEDETIVQSNETTTEAPSEPRPFLDGASVEITTRHGEHIAMLGQRMAPGARVFIAFIDDNDWQSQAATAAEIRAVGLEPVPHVPARFFRDAAQLDEVLARLRDMADVKTVLAIGGDIDEPRGQFDGVPALLATGALEAHGIEKVGFAGHPEGHPTLERACGEAGLVGVLSDKVAYAREAGLSPFIATQFTFDADPILEWLDVLNAAGIDVPVHIGLAGPAKIKTLLAYALRCGVGRSSRVLKRQGARMTKLLTEATPAPIVDALSAARAQGLAPELGAPHFFPFGGFGRLFDWIDEARQS